MDEEPAVPQKNRDTSKMDPKALQEAIDLELDRLESFTAYEDWEQDEAIAACTAAGGKRITTR